MYFLKHTKTYWKIPDEFLVSKSIEIKMKQLNTYQAVSYISGLGVEINEAVAYLLSIKK